MPRVSRRPHRRRSGYRVEHLQVLRHGHNYRYWGLPEFDDLGERRKAWKTFGEEILHDWIRRDPPDGGPLTRPWAWWAFDAPERRRRIDGVHPFDNPERDALIERYYAEHQREPLFRLWYGCPASLVIADDFGARYESQCDYLARLGLLLPGERELT